MEAQVEGPSYGFFGIDLINPSDDDTSYSNIVIGMFWFLVIALMFFAQHHTCDAYFVPAINVFVTKMKGSPSKWLQRWGEQSVAGATICALGCNGPELFSNLISLYTHSDAGIGVVVGSEIFNLLVITGSSVLAAPIIPLALEKLSFTRDVLAYAISIAMLFWALADKKIQFHESVTLLSAAVGYVLMVYFTKDLETYLGMGEPDDDDYKKMVEGGEPDSPTKLLSRSTAGSFRGVQVQVEEMYHGRMVDGHHEAAHKHQWDGSKGAAAIDPMCPITRLEKQLLAVDAKELGDVGYSSLKEVVRHSETVIDLEFEKGFAAGMLLEHVTIRITAQNAADCQTIKDDIKRSALGVDMHDYDSSYHGALHHFKAQMADKDMSLFLKLFLAPPELLIDGVLRLTLCSVDIKDEPKEDRWPLCFLGAMVWLAFFSWCMLECANMIHAFIPVIPTAFLGITVCAVGTSFPNAVASVILSSQGKPGAAIANALGSNVQNVFLAMAFPWVIYQVQHGQADIPQDVAGIQEGVLWMVGTLILLVLLVVMPPCCKITSAAGWILNAVYGVYIIVISGETFGLWPPLLK